MHSSLLTTHNPSSIKYCQRKMELVPECEMDSVLLQLQTALFSYEHEENAVDVTSIRKNLAADVNVIIAELSKARRQKRTLVINYQGQSPKPRRFKILQTHRRSFNFILEYINRLILTNNTATRREIYYQNVRLFRNQSIVDTTVDRICQILNTPQWNLGIYSTSKGLVYGPLRIALNTGEYIDCSQNLGGTLIPQGLPHGATYESSAKFGLIVEKDTAFQNLLSTGLASCLRNCILITGKGYPDMNTRFLVKDISIKLSLPLFALVDADPYGIDIFFNYKYGSLAKVYINEHLAAPHVFWLGVHPSDLTDFSPSSLQLQSLTSRDVRKAGSLLERSYVLEDERIKLQIEILLQNEKKCEIENISSITTRFLPDVYIPLKISGRKFI